MKEGDINFGQDHLDHIRRDGFNPHICAICQAIDEILAKQVEEKMTEEEHITRHKELHKSLDELVADMIEHTRVIPSQTIVIDLIRWSYDQTQNPTERPKE